MKQILRTYAIEHDDKLYLVKKKFLEKANLPIDKIKEYYDCDIVLKKDNIYYFCELIKDVEYDEETSDNKEQDAVAIPD